MNATRWTFSVCILGFAAVITLAACGGNTPDAGSPQALYVEFGCAKCHGEDREGMRSGPPLRNLAERWHEDELIAYLRDPATFVQSNPRLSYLDEQYPIAMPAYPNTPEDHLRAIGQLVLGG